MIWGSAAAAGIENEEKGQQVRAVIAEGRTVKVAGSLPGHSPSISSRTSAFDPTVTLRVL